jgi:quercetin dioxygenase-like cupin family protein
MTLTFKTEKLVLSSDHTMATDIGTYQFNAGEGATRITDKGKSVVVWVKRDGNWLVLTDMFSSDAPPPAPPPQEAAATPTSTIAQELPSNPALAIASTDPALQWSPCPPIFPAPCELTVLHGNPANNNADVFLRVPSQYEIPPHIHSSAERMTLVTGELVVTYQGQDPATLKVGTYAYGPPTRPHKAKCISADPCTLFIAFETPVDALPFEGTLEHGALPQ